MFCSLLQSISITLEVLHVLLGGSLKPLRDRICSIVAQSPDVDRDVADGNGGAKESHLGEPSLPPVAQQLSYVFDIVQVGP